MVSYISCSYMVSQSQVSFALNPHNVACVGFVSFVNGFPFVWLNRVGGKQPIVWEDLFYTLHYILKAILLMMDYMKRILPIWQSSRPKIKSLFSGATFHIPLTKSATLSRLLHCSLWQFSGALLCISRAKSLGAPV